MKYRNAPITNLTVAVLVAGGLGLIGCGPARYPAPRIEDMGQTTSAGPSSLNATREAPPPSGGAVAGHSHAPAPVTQTPAPAPSPAGRTSVPLAVSSAPLLGDLVSDFALGLNSVQLKEPAVVAVLPPFHLNSLFHRYEVSQLGEEISRELLLKLSGGVGVRGQLVSPQLFERRLEEINRSLADLDSPDAAAQLAVRVGARYLVRGLIGGTNQSVDVHLECIDVVDLLPIKEVRASWAAGQSGAREVYDRFKDSTGNVRLGAWRIGALAPSKPASLQAELQLIIADAVHRMMRDASEDLGELPLAVLPTQVPGEIKHEKYQRALDRAVQQEKQRFEEAGILERVVMSMGPVRILGRNFDTLQQAQDHARTKEVERTISDTGLLRDQLSRVIFDIIEDVGDAAGLTIIPHAQLVDQAMLFSKEEGEKLREGSLSEETRNFFQTRGAGALLFTELLESGESYEFVFQLRRMDTLKRLTPPVRSYLEPRFAVQLGQFLKK